MLLGAGRLVGLQEEGREGVDLVRPPHLMGKQRQLHNVEVFIQVLHLWPGQGTEDIGQGPGCRQGQNVGRSKGLRWGPPRVSLHRVTGGSGASEVRVSRAGPLAPQGQRYPGQASQIPSWPELGGRG